MKKASKKVLEATFSSSGKNTHKNVKGLMRTKELQRFPSYRRFRFLNKNKLQHKDIFKSIKTQRGFGQLMYVCVHAKHALPSIQTTPIEMRVLRFKFQNLDAQNPKSCKCWVSHTHLRSIQASRLFSIPN